MNTVESQLYVSQLEVPLVYTSNSCSLLQNTLHGVKQKIIFTCTSLSVLRPNVWVPTWTYNRDSTVVKCIGHMVFPPGNIKNYVQPNITYKWITYKRDFTVHGSRGHDFCGPMYMILWERVTRMALLIAQVCSANFMHLLCQFPFLTSSTWELRVAEFALESTWWIVFTFFKGVSIEPTAPFKMY